jgi:hypothetical protein
MIKRGLRAQASVFIVIAVVLFAAAGLTYFLSKGSVKNNSENAPVYDYVQSCIDDSVINGIRYISFQGGYYNSPEKYTRYGVADVPYYFYLGQRQIPSKSVIEKELSKYIEKELVSCNDKSNFEEQGYSLEFGKPSVKTSLGKEIKVSVNYPIKITKDKKISSLRDFSYSKEFDFDRLYSLINQFSDEHQQNSDFMPLGYLSVLAKNNNFKFNLIYISGNEVVYSFIFNDLFKNESLIYNFAAKYKWEQGKPINKRVEIEEIPDQHVFAGNSFYYKVNARGNNVQFEDYSDLFDINKNTGEIKFRSGQDQSGSYQILIKAYDNSGNEDSKIMNLYVEKVIESGLNLTNRLNVNGSR